MKKLNCAYCNKEFEKEYKEYRRQTKRGRNKFYCDLSCSCAQKNKDYPSTYFKTCGIKREKDQYTPFRWYMLRARYRDKTSRDKKKRCVCDLTKEYLKNLWDEQQGTCPLTGWKLILPKGTGKSWDIKSPYNASLDRIDNSIGYVKGNVRFISIMANLGRAVFSDEQLIDFCKAVTHTQTGYIFS
jgi:hypothetical protein